MLICNDNLNKRMTRGITVKPVTKKEVLEKARKLQQKNNELIFRQKELDYLKEKGEELDKKKADELLASQL